jgi:arginase family enzyme
MQDLHSFFGVSEFDAPAEQTFQQLTWGDTLLQNETGNTIEEADIVIVGCGEMRGAEGEDLYCNAADEVMKQFFQMYNWHPSVKLAYAGCIAQGLTTDDTRAALRTVLEELHDAGKVVLVIGGSHDLTMQQYEAFKKKEMVINATVADMLIDLEETEEMTDRSFLMDMLTKQPNYVRNYSHIGFQSYFVHPRMLETLDKLRFDFFRLGKLRENMDEVEPVLRGSHLFSFDMNAVKYCDAPANINGSPNGFSGDEACLLTRFAGMSSDLSSLGIYGYNPTHDQYQHTAKLIAQMIWYFVDGYMVRNLEASLKERELFMEYHVNATTLETTFLKSKKTNRWWMQLPDGKFIPCTYGDYLIASNNELPERWLREQERLM